MNYFFRLYIVIVLWLGVIVSLPAIVITTPSDGVQDFEEALTLFRGKKYIAAQAYFEKCVQEPNHHVDRGMALYYVALCSMYSKQSDAATRFLNFIKQYPTHSKVGIAYVELGNLFFARKDFKKSIIYYLKSSNYQLDKRKKDESIYSLAYAYLQINHLDQAIYYFNILSQEMTNAYHTIAYYHLGVICLQQKQYQEALIKFQQVLDNEIHKTVAIVGILRVYYEQKEFATLVKYAKGIEDRWISLEAMLLIADAYFFLQKYEEAVTYYQLYKKYSSKKLLREVLYKQGYALYKIQDATNALVCLQKVAVQNDLMGQTACYYMGLINLQIEQKEKALNLFFKVTKMNCCQKIQEQAFVQCAKIIYEQGDFQRVILILINFIKHYPLSQYSVFVNMLLSTSYCSVQDYDAAISYIEGLKIQPKALLKVYQKATCYQGNICFNNKQYKEAKVFFTKSLQYPLDDYWEIQASYWLAETCIALKQYDQAISRYQTCIQSAMHTMYYTSALYGVAYAYFNIKNYEQASTYFEQCIVEARKKNVVWFDDALVRLADCYFFVKQYTKSLQLYNRILHSYPAHVYYHKALICHYNGKIVEAQKNLHIIFNAYTHTIYYEKALYASAYLTFTQGVYTQAIQQFTDFIQKMSHSVLMPDALLYRALAYENLKKNEEACVDYELILQDYIHYDKAKDALLALSRLYITAGKSQNIDFYKQRYQEARSKVDFSVNNLSLDSIRSLFYTQNYKEVIDQLKPFVAHSQQNITTTEAAFLIAESYYRMNDPVQSLTYYKKALQYPKTASYNKILLRIATLSYNAQLFGVALSYYQKLKASTSNKKEILYALKGIIKSSYVLKEYKLTKKTATFIINQHNVDMQYVHDALLYLAKISLCRKEYKNARIHLIRLLKSTKDHRAAEAQYLLSVVEYKMNHYKTSLDLLFDLHKKFSAYAYWFDRSFLLIADNYIALKNKPQAEATLQSIVKKATDPEVILTAKKKISLLHLKKNA